jgi:hypothetical protein
MAKLNLPPCTSELLAAGTHYDHPPTEFAVPSRTDDFRRPRSVMIFSIIRKALLREYLMRGLVRGEDGKLRFPEIGSVSKEEIDEISECPTSLLILTIQRTT